MLFITNGFKHFLSTNLSDPRQRVPLMSAIYKFIINLTLTLMFMCTLYFPECCEDSVKKKNTQANHSGGFELTTFCNARAEVLPYI